MDAWQSCVGAALVGTDRQTPELREKGALGKVVCGLDWSEPERALLGAVGAISLHKQVGWRPEKKDFALVEACDPADLPCCSQRTERHLEVAMEKHPEVLPELLGLMAAAGQRIPAQRLPEVLNFGKRNKVLRPQLLAVLGKRGQWLAAQNSFWQYAVQEAGGRSPTAQLTHSDKLEVNSEKAKPAESLTAVQWLNQKIQRSQRWDISLSQQGLKRFFEAAKDKANHIELSRIAIPLAVSLHPGLAPQMSGQVKQFSQDGLHSTLQTFLDRAASLITLRWEIYQSFVSDG